MLLNLNKIRLFLIEALLLCVFSTNAQQVASIIPPDISQNPYYLAARNPSFLCQDIDSGYVINSAYLGYTGIRSPNNLTYISLSGILKSKNRTQKNIVGFHLNNQVTGKFFRVLRLYGDYKYEMLLRQDLKLAAAISIGVFNSRVFGAQYTSGSSTFALDGNIGINLSSKRSEFGLSIIQLFNNKTEFDDTPSKLERHGFLYFSYDLAPMSIINYNVFTSYSYIPSLISQLNIGITALYHKKVGVQFIGSYPKGGDLGLIIRKISLYKGFLDFGISYNLLSTNQIVPGSHHYEITLRYYK